MYCAYKSSKNPIQNFGYGEFSTDNLIPCCCSRLEQAHSNFDGSQDDEEDLLEQLKRQQEVLDIERKVCD